MYMYIMYNFPGIMDTGITKPNIYIYFIRTCTIYIHVFNFYVTLLSL